MRAALQRAWLHRGALACCLLPLAWLYGLVTSARRTLFRSGVLRTHRLPVPVVVVGNVVAGGAGKTPVVIALARHLRSRGIRAGVVSRGYGRQGDGCLEVMPETDPLRAGDEPLLVATSAAVPVMVAADRPLAGRKLLAAHPGVQVVVSDDGLQHLALARDIEVLVFDDRGAGNGWLLPAGPLREPWPRTRAADLVLSTAGAGGVGGFRIGRRLASEVHNGRGERRPLRSLAGGPCAAVAGIAQPEAFFRMLDAAGLTLHAKLALPDHHDYAQPLAADVGGLPLLCTEKDAAKLWRQRPDAWAVPLEVDIDPAFWRAFDALLDAKLSSTDGPQAA